MLRTRFTKFSFLLLLSALTTVVIAGPPPGKGKGGGGEEPPPQPAVQYQLNLDIVADIPNSYSGLNEIGEYVGYLTDYTPNGVRVPFLYDSLSGQVTYINGLLDPSSLPSGWSFAAALDINDHGVVVGYATDEFGVYHACAVDLAQASPGVDILPTILGSRSTALKINNAGIILGIEDQGWSDSGSWDLCWTLDTGLYGPPASRVATDAEPAIVPVVTTNGDPDLSEKSAAGVTWVGGLEESEVGNAPFRYVVGAPAVELFSQFAYKSGIHGGINTSGNFAGSATVVTGRKGKRDVSTRLAYRYDSAATGYTTITEEYYSTQDINNFDEVLLIANGRCGVFRDFGDDMGERLVPLDDLVVGSNPDLAIWFSNNVRGLAMNDAGLIVGSIVDDETGVSYLFSLVPESTNP